MQYVDYPLMPVQYTTLCTMSLLSTVSNMVSLVSSQSTMSMLFQMFVVSIVMLGLEFLHKPRCTNMDTTQNWRVGISMSKSHLRSTYTHYNAHGNKTHAHLIYIRTCADTLESFLQNIINLLCTCMHIAII